MANIFIVEDDRASARLLGLLLKKGNHSSSVAYSLEEARKWLYFQPEFDLMILDNRLGDNYGWELLSELRNHFYFRNLPVIVYTAAGDRDSVSKYVALKVQAIRAKPYKRDVIDAEVARAVKTGWQSKDFVTAEYVTDRLGIPLEEYIGGLRAAEQQLTTTAKQLLELLVPSKERQFVALLDELRSHALNLGLNIVVHVIKECVEAFREHDWSRAVKGIRTFNIIAKRLRKRSLSLSGEPDDAMGVPREEEGSISMPPKVREVPARSNGADPRPHSTDLPAGFTRMAAAFAQGETVEMLVRKCLRGSISEDDAASLQDSLAHWVQWLAFLEPNDLDAVTAVVGEGEGTELRLRGPASSGKSGSHSLREFIADQGVFESGLQTGTLRLLDELKRAGFPVALENLARRQLVSAYLMRALAARIERSVNLEAVIWLQFIGEWVFALRFPGVYGLILLEPANHPVRKYKSAFNVMGRAFISRLKLPDYCQKSLNLDDESSFSEMGSARLSRGLFTLACLVADGYAASERGQNLDGISREFSESTAWNLLAEENLQLPGDRARYFKGLLDSIPAMHQRVDALLAHPVKNPAAVS